jgi:hypothetical protein
MASATVLAFSENHAWKRRRLGGLSFYNAGEDAGASRSIYVRTALQSRPTS